MKDEPCFDFERQILVYDEKNVLHMLDETKLRYELVQVDVEWGISVIYEDKEFDIVLACAAMVDIHKPLLNFLEEKLYILKLEILHRLIFMVGVKDE